jgi:Ni,Fe-hydrogenase III small subunit/ferredoxin-like protein FixX
MTDESKNHQIEQNMSQWVINGLRTGIKTTVYPRGEEHAAGVTSGLPHGNDALSPSAAAALVECCPTQVFSQINDRISADSRRCIHCYRCVRGIEHPAGWRQSYEWATVRPQDAALNEFNPAFKRSFHICVVDAGDCGACLNEVKQLNNPYYNMHRLGFFITPSPRHADVLLVVGPVTDHMRVALQKIHDAMPTPKRVIAVGACALTGGVFAKSFVCANGVGEVLPVDVEVPGNPPPPLAILHGLLVAVGRKSPASLNTPASAMNTNALKY